MTKTKGIPLAPVETIVGVREENLSSLQRDDEEEEMLRLPQFIKPPPAL